MRFGADPLVVMDSRWWPAIADVLIASGAPWPEDAILADLRWWQDQERVGRASRPGRPTLEKRWKVGGTVAKRLLKAEDRWGLERGPTSDRPATDQPATSRDEVEPVESADIDQPATSDRPATVPTRVGTFKQSTVEQESEQTSAPEPAPVKPPRKPRGVKEPKPPPSLPPGVAEVWAAYKATLGPTRGEAPPKGWGVAARVSEHGTEAVIRVVRWVAESPHSRAVFLRTNGYTGDTLFRPEKFGEYLALSSAPPPRGGQMGLGLSPMPPTSTLDDWVNEDPMTNQFLRPLLPDNGVYDGE